MFNSALSILLRLLKSTWPLIFIAVTSYFFDTAFNFYYTYKFKVAAHPDVYGPIGDFFGGILNPILGFINIIVLIIITYLVATNEKKRHRSQFRYQAYLDFKDKMSSHVQDPTADMSKVLVTYNEMLKQLNIFKDYSMFLYDNTGWDLSTKIDTLKVNIEEQIELATRINEISKTSTPPQIFINAFNEGESNIDTNRTVVLFEMQMQVLN